MVKNHDMFKFLQYSRNIKKCIGRSPELFNIWTETYNFMISNLLMQVEHPVVVLYVDVWKTKTQNKLQDIMIFILLYTQKSIM